MTNTEIATVIRDQIRAGDRTFFMCVAARAFIAIENGLRFKVGNNPKLSHVYVEVVLTPADDYTVTIFKVRKLVRKIAYQVDHVYCDQLADILNSEIG